MLSALVTLCSEMTVCPSVKREDDRRDREEKKKNKQNSQGNGTGSNRTRWLDTAETQGGFVLFRRFNYELVEKTVRN